MIRKKLLFAVAGLLLAGSLSAQTVDEILAKHFAALGGKEKIKAIQSAKISGKQTFGPQEAPFTIYWKRPAKFRLEFTLQGMTGIQAYDGTTGWSVMPFLGKSEPEKMSEDDLKNIQEQADMIDGPLMDYQDKGNQVELIGKEEVEGTPAYKMKVTRKNGDVTYIYFDAEAMVQIKAEGKRTMRGQEIEFEGAMGDYKEVHGLYFPYSLENKPKGAPQGSMITIEKYEFDVEIPDSTFTMPEVKPAEPAKPGGN